MSFRDFEKFTAKYSYDVNALIYFKCDNRSFKNVTRYIYDDKPILDLIAIHKPYDWMDLYVDHFEFDDLIDVPNTSK